MTLPRPLELELEPDGNTFNQIAHVMIDKRRASSITNVRTYRGASCGWDHFLVKVVFRRRSTRANMGGSQKVTRLDINRLKEEEMRDKFKIVINSNIKSSNLQNNIDNMIVENFWESVKKTVLTRPRIR